MNRLLRTVAVPLAVVALAVPAGGVSLWRPDGSLYGQRTGFRPGDLITIVVSEQSSANHDWKHEREKEYDLELDLDNNDPPAAFSGNLNPLNQILPFLEADVRYQSEFESDNKTDRRLRVAARLTGQVLEVLPNGNLRVEAKKRITVNNEEQTLFVRGLVRPQDVRPDNTVQSTALAEGEVELVGSLAFRNASRNPISAFFSWLGSILF